MTTSLVSDNVRCEYYDLGDHTLDNVPHLCRLDNGRHRPTPKYPLGTLEQLPPEIHNMILLYLDIRALTDLRRISRRVMQVIDSIPAYKAIVQHAPYLLRAILSINTGQWIVCQDLYANYTQQSATPAVILAGICTCLSHTKPLSGSLDSSLSVHLILVLVLVPLYRLCKSFRASTHLGDLNSPTGLYYSVMILRENLGSLRTAV
ncbi:uncharacterized protein BDV14DRAFT_204147 [Aspergillus stella-maris]|uniref:uncharacterized protein n=1 Tax=Aspergillus stella-maris TaxID=1810926 RepID=UPI003CCDDD4F